MISFTNLIQDHIPIHSNARALNGPDRSKATRSAVPPYITTRSAQSARPSIEEPKLSVFLVDGNHITYECRIHEMLFRFFFAAEQHALWYLSARYGGQRIPDIKENWAVLPYDGQIALSFFVDETLEEFVSLTDQHKSQKAPASRSPNPFSVLIPTTGQWATPLESIDLVKSSVRTIPTPALSTTTASPRTIVDPVHDRRGMIFQTRVEAQMFAAKINAGQNHPRFCEVSTYDPYYQRHNIEHGVVLSVSQLVAMFGGLSAPSSPNPVASSLPSSPTDLATVGLALAPKNVGDRDWLELWKKSLQHEGKTDLWLSRYFAAYVKPDWFSPEIVAAAKAAWEA